ncbi:MAG: lytic transglycosylase domain-containing protein [Desulfovibrionaceae bacterium]|nr:lytic transglycosylase domain-containing protein [Desulfovibrionaceae bacterium]MBF0515379.1 lytic transglycosylase domain-containing protein [Desulfovibrionaceae bacterium]
MPSFDDYSDDNGYGGGFGGDLGQSGGQSSEPYYQVKPDGPFAGWTNEAMDNLKDSLSPMDFAAFLNDRIDTHFANAVNRDPNAPSLAPELDYEPTDYGAPATGQADNAGQTGGSDTGAAGDGGWFTSQGLYQNQNPLPGAGFGGQAADRANPGNFPGGYGGRGTGWPYPANPLGGYSAAGGFAPPTGYPNQAPPFGIDPGFGGQPGGWTSPSDAPDGLGGQGGGLANPYASMPGQGTGWTSPSGSMGGLGSPGLAPPSPDPYDPSHLDRLIPILTQPLPSGIGLDGWLTNQGLSPNQTPPAGNDSDYGNQAGDWTNPNDPSGGYGNEDDDWMNPNDQGGYLTPTAGRQPTQGDSGANTQGPGSPDWPIKHPELWEGLPPTGKSYEAPPQQIKDLIDYWGRYYGIPEDMFPLLYRMAQEESEYGAAKGTNNPVRDAQGVMQVTQVSLDEYNKSNERMDRSKLSDPSSGIRAGVWTFRDKLNRQQYTPGAIRVYGGTENPVYANKFNGYYDLTKKWSPKK